MNEIKRVNLALQGGGSHGAFTWCVLDALLEDERLMVEAVSGTSAGAMNAAILLQGWTVGGRAGARTALRAFWSELGTMSITSPIQRTPLDRLQGNWNLDDSPGALWADLIQRTLTPWQRNPLKFDPLRELLRRHFDEKTVRAMDVLAPRIGEIIGGSQREERYDVLKQKIKDGGMPEEAYWWYLELRKYGSAPHAGFGLGLERMLMYVTGMKNIRDAIPFYRVPGSAEF